MFRSLFARNSKTATVVSRHVFSCKSSSNKLATTFVGNQLLVREFHSTRKNSLYFAEEQPLGNIDSTEGYQKQLYSLPAKYFYDEDIFKKEMKTIFEKSWQYVGHVNDVAQPGNYFTYTVGNENVFVVKDRTNTIRCFYNVCPHRAHQLVKGRGTKPVIVCPNHSWSFKLDGSFLKARNIQDLKDFDPSLACLKEIKLENFNGLLFANLDNDAKSITEMYKAPELLGKMQETIPEIPNMQCVSRKTKIVKANWKIVVDNFLECYHCETAHKSFCTMAQLDEYRQDTFEFYSHTRAPCNPENSVSNFKDDDPCLHANYFWMWPNVVSYCQPGKYNMSILQFLPISPTETLRVAQRYFVDTNLDEQDEKLVSFLNDTLLEEDTALCESMQKGVQSRAYTQGMFVVDTELSHNSEHGLHQFHKKVKDFVQV